MRVIAVIRHVIAAATVKILALIVYQTVNAEKRLVIVSITAAIVGVIVLNTVVTVIPVGAVIVTKIVTKNVKIVAMMMKKNAALL